MDKKVIFSFVVALVGGLAIGYIVSKKGEKKSSVMGDGDFKAGAYEKAW